MIPCGEDAAALVHISSDRRDLRLANFFIFCRQHFAVVVTFVTDEPYLVELGQISLGKIEFVKAWRSSVVSQFEISSAVFL